MDIRTMMKIERSFCGLRVCDMVSCPFSPAYNENNYICQGYCCEGTYVDKATSSIFAWLKNNEVNTDLEVILNTNGVYDAFMERFEDISWV